MQRRLLWIACVELLLESACSSAKPFAPGAGVGLDAECVHSADCSEENVCVAGRCQALTCADDAGCPDGTTCREGRFCRISSGGFRPKILSVTGTGPGGRLLPDGAVSVQGEGFDALSKVDLLAADGSVLGSLQVASSGSYNILATLPLVVDGLELPASLRLRVVTEEGTGSHAISLQRGGPGPRGPTGAAVDPALYVARADVASEYVAPGPTRINGGLSAHAALRTTRDHRLFVGPAALMAIGYWYGQTESYDGIDSRVAFTGTHATAHLQLPEGSRPTKLVCTFIDNEPTKSVSARIQRYSFDADTHTRAAAESCLSVGTQIAYQSANPLTLVDASPSSVEDACRVTSYSDEDGGDENSGFVLVAQFSGSTISDALAVVGCVVHYTLESL